MSAIDNTVRLHYKIFSSRGAPLIILHGLFGSLENWATQAKALSDEFAVVAVDLRNHGRSPHCRSMDYPVMAADVSALVAELGLESAAFIGHSMGGKTAMQLALDYPQKVDKLVVADIAPRRYPPYHDEIFQALDSLDLPHLASRQDADQQLLAAVPEFDVRAFILKNLQRTKSGFAWKINLPALRANYANICAAVHGGATPFMRDVLFVKGGLSNYLQASDREEIAALFPRAKSKLIQNAGHWPHSEKATIFTKIARDFLGSGANDECE